jgi:hypothetical protein
MRVLICAVLLAAVACGEAPPVATPAVTGTPTPAPVLASPRGVPEPPDPEWWPTKLSPEALRLADGRRLEMYYERGSGLFERHTDRNGRWSEPRLLYKTGTDPCQSIELASAEGVVTAIADFGNYCYDGEPPFESIAAVGLGDLRRWDHHLTRSFDGWARAAVAPGGRKVTFSRNSTEWRFRLVWTAGGGFGTARKTPR